MWGRVLSPLKQELENFVSQQDDDDDSEYEEYEVDDDGDGWGDDDDLNVDDFDDLLEGEGGDGWGDDELSNVDDVVGDTEETKEGKEGVNVDIPVDEATTTHAVVNDTVGLLPLQSLSQPAIIKECDGSNDCNHDNHNMDKDEGGGHNQASSFVEESLTVRKYSGDEDSAATKDIHLIPVCNENYDETNNIDLASEAAISFSQRHASQPFVLPPPLSPSPMSPVLSLATPLPDGDTAAAVEDTETPDASAAETFIPSNSNNNDDHEKEASTTSSHIEKDAFEDNDDLHYLHVVEEEEEDELGEKVGKVDNEKVADEEDGEETSIENDDGWSDEEDLDVLHDDDNEEEGQEQFDHKVMQLQDFVLQSLSFSSSPDSPPNLPKLLGNDAIDSDSDDESVILTDTTLDNNGITNNMDGWNNAEDDDILSKDLQKTNQDEELPSIPSVKHAAPAPPSPVIDIAPKTDANSSSNGNNNMTTTISGTSEKHKSWKGVNTANAYAAATFLLSPPPPLPMHPTLVSVTASEKIVPTVMTANNASVMKDAENNNISGDEKNKSIAVAVVNDTTTVEEAVMDGNNHDATMEDLDDRWNDDVDDIDLDDNETDKHNDENISGVLEDNNKHKHSNGDFENNKGEVGDGDGWDDEDDMLMEDVDISDDAAAGTNDIHPNESEAVAVEQEEDEQHTPSNDVHANNDGAIELPGDGLLINRLFSGGSRILESLAPPPPLPPAVPLKSQVSELPPPPTVPPKFQSSEFDDVIVDDVVQEDGLDDTNIKFPHPPAAAPQSLPFQICHDHPPTSNRMSSLTLDPSLSQHVVEDNDTECVTNENNDTNNVDATDTIMALGSFDDNYNNLQQYEQHSNSGSILVTTIPRRNDRDSFSVCNNTNASTLVVSNKDESCKVMVDQEEEEDDEDARSMLPLADDDNDASVRDVPLSSQTCQQVTRISTMTIDPSVLPLNEDEGDSDSAAPLNELSLSLQQGREVSRMSTMTVDPFILPLDEDGVDDDTDSAPVTDISLNFQKRLAATRMSTMTLDPSFLPTLNSDENDDDEDNVKYHVSPVNKLGCRLPSQQQHNEGKADVKADGDDSDTDVDSANFTTPRMTSDNSDSTSNLNNIHTNDTNNNTIEGDEIRKELEDLDAEVDRLQAEAEDERKEIFRVMDDGVLFSPATNEYGNNLVSSDKQPDDSSLEEDQIDDKGEGSDLLHSSVSTINYDDNENCVDVICKETADDNDGANLTMSSPVGQMMKRFEQLQQQYRQVGPDGDHHDGKITGIAATTTPNTSLLSTTSKEATPKVMNISYLAQQSAAKSYSSVTLSNIDKKNVFHLNDVAAGTPGNKSDAAVVLSPSLSALLQDDNEQQQPPQEPLPKFDLSVKMKNIDNYYNNLNNTTTCLDSPNNRHNTDGEHNRIKELERQIAMVDSERGDLSAKLVNNINSLKQEISCLSESKIGSNEKVKDLDLVNESLQQQISSLTKEKNDKMSMIEMLVEKVEDVEEELETSGDQYKEQINGMLMENEQCLYQIKELEGKLLVERKEKEEYQQRQDVKNDESLLEKKTSEIQQLEQDNAQLQSQLSTAMEERTELKGCTQDLKAQLASREEHLVNSQDQNSELKIEVERTKQQMKKLWYDHLADTEKSQKEMGHKLAKQVLVVQRHEETAKLQQLRLTEFETKLITQKRDFELRAETQDQSHQSELVTLQTKVSTLSTENEGLQLLASQSRDFIRKEAKHAKEVSGLQVQIQNLTTQNATKTKLHRVNMMDLSIENESEVSGLKKQVERLEARNTEYRIDAETARSEANKHATELSEEKKGNDRDLHRIKTKLSEEQKLNALHSSEHVNAVKKLELSARADMELYQNETQATFQTQMTTITEQHQIQITDLTKEKEGLQALVTETKSLREEMIASTNSAKRELLAMQSDLESKENAALEQNASVRQKLEMERIRFQQEAELLKQQVQELNVKNENLVTQSNAMKQALAAAAALSQNEVHTTNSGSGSGEMDDKLERLELENKSLLERVQISDVSHEKKRMEFESQMRQRDTQLLQLQTDKKDLIVKSESLQHEMDHRSNCVQREMNEAATRLEMDKVAMLAQIESLQTEKEINDTQWKTQIEQRNVQINNLQKQMGTIQTEQQNQSRAYTTLKVQFTTQQQTVQSQSQTLSDELIKVKDLQQQIQTLTDDNVDLSNDNEEALIQLALLKQQLEVQEVELSGYIDELHEQMREFEATSEHNLVAAVNTAREEERLLTSTEVDKCKVVFLREREELQITIADVKGNSIITIKTLQQELQRKNDKFINQTQELTAISEILAERESQIVNLTDNNKCLHNRLDVSLKEVVHQRELVILYSDNDKKSKDGGNQKQKLLAKSLTEKENELTKQKEQYELLENIFNGRFAERDAQILELTNMNKTLHGRLATSFQELVDHKLELEKMESVKKRNITTKGHGSNDDQHLHHLQLNELNKLTKEVEILRKSITEKERDLVDCRDEILSAKSDLDSYRGEMIIKEDEMHKMETQLLKGKQLQQQQQKLLDQKQQQKSYVVVRTEDFMNANSGSDDPHSIDAMRTQIISLAKALEKSEISRADALERIVKERKTNAESLKKIGGSVKRFYSSIASP